MSKKAKTSLIAAAALIVIGLGLFCIVMTVYHWDFSRLNTEKFETNTYEISEDFDRIILNSDTSDILFAASDRDICSVICYEPESTKHSVKAEDGALTIRTADNRKWYDHIAIRFNSPRVTVYLPKAEYASLSVKGSTGDITLQNEMTLDHADISVSTGDIRIDHLSAGTLDLSVSTGEITVSDVTCRGDINISSTTGNVKMTNVTCQSLLSGGSTGDIALRNVIAAGKLSIERSTGDIIFNASDAAEISMKTSTGDVTGSFLTEKEFAAETSTGSISVPRNAEGGRCGIITSTGNIKIEISDGSDE